MFRQLPILLLTGCASLSPSTGPGPDHATTSDSIISLPASAETSIITAPAATTENPGETQNTESQATKEYADVWERIRAGFTMERLDNSRVDQHERWFASNPSYMERMTERAKLYLHYIVEEVEKRGMPMEIALLPAIESAYKPYAYSRARAVGLWQFIPSTGRLYGLKMNWWYDGRRDVMASTQAALNYLEKLYSDFDGDWHLALAAYNAGEGKIMRAVDYNKRRNRPADYSHLRLRRETVNYVPKLMAMANIVSDPDKHGVNLADIPNAPYFTQVETGAQIDLGVVARLVDVDINELHSINPGYSRWATDPDGPHHLLIPVEKKDTLIEGLKNLPEDERIQWRRHAVHRGDTLYDIARRYGVSVEAIKTANRLHSNLLRAGQSLLIPFSNRKLTPVVASAPKRNFVPPSGAEPIVHRVRAGETLWGIARRYNVFIHQIAEWNLIGTRDILRLGQKLKIWPSMGPSARNSDSRTS
jgi:membrane-bound lytic murein transglycosylase D